MLINFADKAVVGLASVPIMQELKLSHTQFGMLGSAFFLLFSASGVAVGFLANRFSTKAIMCIMGVAWSAALLPMTMISSFTLLVTSRVILGAAEGPAFPVAVHAVYQWFANAHRALPTSVVASGAAFGAGIVAPLILWIIDHFGWHAAFGTLGVVGLGGLLVGFCPAVAGIPVFRAGIRIAKSGALSTSADEPHGPGVLSGWICGVLDHCAQSGMAGQLFDQGVGDGSCTRSMGHRAAFRHAVGAGTWGCISVAKTFPDGFIESSRSRRSGHSVRHHRRPLDGLLSFRRDGASEDLPRGIGVFDWQRHLHAGSGTHGRDFARIAARRDARSFELDSYPGGRVRAPCDGAHRGH